MLRITSGFLRGRKLPTPKSKAVRPLPDKVRLALGNILQAELEGARVLDVFAGMGAFAFEAISRGAAEAVLVEKSRTHASYIRKAADDLGISNRVRVLGRDAFKSEKTYSEYGPFDIIFLGPPYPIVRQRRDIGRMETLVHNLLENNLSKSGILLVQLPKGTDFRPGNTAHYDKRTYGEMEFYLYCK